MRSKFLWAALALAAVLGITTAASATTRGLITGKQIAPHTISSKHLVNHTIQKHDLSRGLISSLHGARGARGPMGPMGPFGATRGHRGAGPGRPKGTSDSTVRRINTWLPADKTLTAPVISASGQLGTLSLTCGSVTYTKNPADVSQWVAYYSPNIANSASVAHLYPGQDHVAILWNNPQSGNWIEMMIEGKAGGSMSLTTIHGYMQTWVDYAVRHCLIYFTMDSADIAAPTTTTPTC